MKLMNSDPVHLRSVLEQILKDFGTPDINSITSIVDQWEDIVGSELASKISAVAFKGSELIVRVDDPAWASQLTWLESQLLEKIEKILGAEKVSSIRVRTNLK